MAQVKDLTEVTLRDLWREVKGDGGWWDDVKEESLQMLKRLLESTMEEEIAEQLQVEWYRRSQSRRGHRNGYRYRCLLTQLGLLAQIRVPSDREGRYDPGVLPRYERRRREVDDMVREMFLSGVTTRRVEEVVAPLLVKGVSAQTVSRITRSLDSEVFLYHSRLIADQYQYLLPDGITLKAKGATGAKKRLVPCAYGITWEGHRELISFRQEVAESEAQWLAFLEDLYRRGLEGKALQLVTTDGCPGLSRALDIVYPYLPRQRCWAHKLRNAASRLRRNDQELCLAKAKGIYLAGTRRETTARYRTWANHWQEVAPGAVACLGNDLDELLAFLDCPQGHWKRRRTTNAIERAFREVRRRTRPMSCFQNSASVDRIIYGVFAPPEQGMEG